MNNLTNPTPVQETLRNLVVISNNDDIEYFTLPNGKHLMGLVEIKIAQQKIWQSDEMEDVYKLVFRSKKDTNGYVNIRLTPRWSPRSNLYKALSNMTDGAMVLEQTSEQVYTALLGMLGKWFQVSTIQKPWVNKQGESKIWVSIRDNLIQPIDAETAKKAPNAVSYFQKLDGIDPAKESSNKTGFESMPDALPLAGKVPAKPVTKQQPLEPAPWESDELPF